MKPVPSVFVLVALLLAESATAVEGPALLWGKQFGDSAGQSGVTLTTDAGGNVYMAGDFRGTMNFGGGNITATSFDDIFLVKFGPLGNRIWDRHIGNVGGEHARSLATDPSGNIFLSGHFTGTINLGDGDVTSAGPNDVFLAKYSPAGALLWKRTSGDASDQLCFAVATDAVGSVYMAGYFTGAVNFGGGALVSAGDYDMYIAKYNSAGVYQWSQRFGDAGHQEAYSLATDNADNVYLLGDFQGTINFGVGNMTAVGNSDISLAKFSSAGVCLWSKRFGFLGDSTALDIATDLSGNIFIAGHFICCMDFGGGFLFENGGAYDIFIAKLDPSGTHIWSKDFGSFFWDQMKAIAVDGDGSVFLYGEFRGTLDFGGGPIASSEGTLTEPFVAKLDEAGDYVWSDSYPTPSVGAWDIAVTPRDVFITGSFSATIDFGAGPLVDAGGGDAYLAKFSQFIPAPIIGSIADVANDEGHQVSIQFSRSGYDEPAAVPITQYEIYREEEPALSAALVATPGRPAIPGWVLAATVAAQGSDEYLTSAPTLVDSTLVNGQHHSPFFVRAITANPSISFDSPVDSGYSKDNIPPGVPSNLQYAGGQLTWDASSAPDFEHFTVYGSATDDFASAAIVNVTVAPTLDVSGSSHVFFFVTATDVSGNEGDPAGLNTLTGVGSEPTNDALSISSFPNPFNPTTTIRYTLPSNGHVTVIIYDARGSLVATLVDAERPRGVYTIEWTGHDNGGHSVSSGVYFAQVTHSAGTRSDKLVLLK